MRERDTYRGAYTCTKETKGQNINVANYVLRFETSTIPQKAQQDNKKPIGKRNKLKDFQSNVDIWHLHCT